MSLKDVMLVTGALALAAAPAAAQQKPPIKIGAILPMTGFAATYGDLFKTGAVMGVEDINAAGGVNGSKIELVMDDDQLTATQSVTLFRKEAAEGVFAEVGPVSGTSWENVVPLADQMQVPVINTTALKPGITKQPWALRIAPADDTLVPEGVKEFVVKFPDVKKIVVTGDLKEASGEAGVNELVKAAKANGLEVLDVVGYETRTTDFSPVVIKIRGLNPDAVFTSSLVPTSLALYKELETQGFDKPILSNGLIWAGNLIHAVGSAGKNLYTIGFNSNEPDPGNPKHDAYVERFLKITAATTKLPQPANVSNTGVYYDAMMILAQIMREKHIDGTTDVATARKQIMEGLNSLKTWQGLFTITMRSTGDGYITAHLMAADTKEKIWRYALPPDKRNKPMTVQ
jgi:branched-chain amino acid transport system substrate-binding protein